VAAGRAAALAIALCLPAGEPAAQASSLPSDRLAPDPGTRFPALADAASADRPTGDAAAPLDPRQRRNTRLVVAGAAAVVMVYGGNKWWGDGFSGGFKTQYEGWFGRDTRYGGADKLGHAFSNYAGTRLLSWTFEGIGHDPERARRLAFATTLGTFTAVELVDGYAKNWAFSREDALMNLAGAGVGYLAEKYPAFDALVDFRLHYRPSNDGGSRQAWDPLGDYGGQTWVLALKGSGVPGLANRSPWRYLELAVGYNARGFDDVGGLPGERSRRLYLGISLNLSKVLDATAFRDRADGRARRIAHGVLEFVQVPGTGAYATHRF